MLEEKELDQFVDIFYKNFFEMAPIVELLFKNTELGPQKEELKKGIQKILSNLDNRIELDKYLHELGIRHLAYQIRPNHYRLVKNSMVEAFKMAKGDNCTDTLLNKWIERVDYISEKMQEGAQEVEKVG
ncbi:MAG: hypothetical protein H6622_16145 [Halobacteriovoraceae bacterium]|nr:hypothetical protein [Halobacteriovoraceae bacterium]